MSKKTLENINFASKILLIAISSPPLGLNPIDKYSPSKKKTENWSAHREDSNATESEK